jgi:hypothetical protein
MTWISIRMTSVGMETATPPDAFRWRKNETAARIERPFWFQFVKCRMTARRIR